MLAVAAAARDHSAGHPLWHLLIVAAGALGMFVLIKAKEHWNHDGGPRRPNRAVRVDEPTHAHRARWFPTPTRPVLALATLSAATGAIHAAVSKEHFQEAFIYGAFFLAASTLQAAWAVVLVYRPNRTLLVVGTVANAAIIMLWTFTRTVGVPLGPQSWSPEPIGTLDVISTLVELAIVLGAATLLARGTTLRAPDTVTQRLQTMRTQHPALIRERNDVARQAGIASPTG
jgi:hypothetical protein